MAAIPRRLVVLILLLAAGAARANLPTSFPPTTAPATDSAGDWGLCDAATRAAERATGVPDELLTAISRVEAGRTDPVTGVVRGWPWTIDVEGTGHVYPTEAAAIAAVGQYEQAGARSIDIGCMQVNLRQHPDAFGSLAEAFDPATNAAWAARFLTDLFHQTGSWPHAAAAYHSMTPELGADYQAQVLRMWADGDGSASPARRNAPVVRRPTIPTAPVMAVSATGGPFGADHAPLIASRYGPPTGSASGRGLSAYRAMPIALALRPPFRPGL